MVLSQIRQSRATRTVTSRPEDAAHLLLLTESVVALKHDPRRIWLKQRLVQPHGAGDGSCVILQVQELHDAGSGGSVCSKVAAAAAPAASGDFENQVRWSNTRVLPLLCLDM